MFFESFYKWGLWFSPLIYTSRSLRPAANWFFHLCSAYEWANIWFISNVTLTGVSVYLDFTVTVMMTTVTATTTNSLGFHSFRYSEFPSKFWAILKSEHLRNECLHPTSDPLINSSSACTTEWCDKNGVNLIAFLFPKYLKDTEDTTPHVSVS